jgi:hypothetical protein
MSTAHPNVKADQLPPETPVVTAEFETPSPQSIANQRLENDTYALAARTKLGAAPGTGTLAVKHDKDGSSGGTNAPVKKKAAGFAGMTLGKNAANQPVVVKREVGSPKGYDDRFQATAVARMFKADPAVVVQGKDGKWHALETTAGFNSGPVSNAQLVTYGVPSSADIPAARQKLDSIRARLAEINNLQSNGKNSKSLEEEESKLVGELTKARVTFVALVLGVPESDVNLIRNSMGRAAGKVNINADPSAAQSASGRHGAAQGQSADFTADRVTAIEITAGRIDQDRAAGTLFHEVIHLKDHDLAQKWVKKYEAAGRTFVAGQAGREPFMKWMYSQAPKHISSADAELVIDVASDNMGTTEARANVRTFTLLLQSGSPDATASLVAYARELKPGGQYGAPAPGSYVQAELVQELKTAYKQMSKDMQKQFDAAVAAAKKENPQAWVSRLDFKK